MGNIKNNIKQKLGSRSGRNTLTFTVFLVIATIFWFLMSLNDEVQRDYELQISVNNLPQDINLLTADDELPTINVSVRDKGSNHFSRQFIAHQNLKIDYKDFIDTDHKRLTLGESQLNAQLRQYFGTTATILSHAPDSLSISYTTLPPRKIPVVINSEIIPNAQYVQSGPIKISHDSVLVYSSSTTLNSLQSIPTSHFQLNDLKDTTVVMVDLQVPAGCRVVPSKVKITIPVEPLVRKSFSIPVEAINVPHGMNLVTFPSTVTFSCLVPMSQYNSPDYPIKAYADFDKRYEEVIPLEMSLIPENYINETISPSQVEYMLESPQL